MFKFIKRPLGPKELFFFEGEGHLLTKFVVKNSLQKPWDFVLAHKSTPPDAYRSKHNYSLISQNVQRRQLYANYQGDNDVNDL